MNNKTYLDYNATAPMRPEVYDAIIALMPLPHNASAVHAMGREGKRIIDNARESVALLCGADTNNVIFNSGATEGNNTVLKHFAAQGKILISDMEHPSVLQALPDAIKIPSTPDGVVDLNALDQLLTDHKPQLVSVMLVNNETGIIQPVDVISKMAQKHGAFLHSDCTQAAGRIPLDINELGIHFAALSAHKISGPQGVGALVLGLCGETPVLLDGGGQEKRARAGTENVAGIAGFGIAANLAHSETQDYQSRLKLLQQKLENGIATIAPDAKIYGQNHDRVSNTTMFSLPRASSETMLMAFDLDGIAISNGSACSSGSVKASHVLLAMHEKERASNALRISTGWHTNESDIDRFLEVFEKIYKRLK